MILGLLFAFAGAAVASYYSKIELDKILLLQQQDLNEGNSASLEISDSIALTRSDNESSTDQTPNQCGFSFGNAYHDVAQQIDDNQHELT